MKKLYRDTANEMIAGVCSGVAKYLYVDPTIVRIIWACAVLFAGGGLLLYIICAIIIPAEPSNYYADYDEAQRNWEYQQQNQQNQQYQPNNANYYNPDQQYNQGPYYDPNSHQE